MILNFNYAFGIIVFIISILLMITSIIYLPKIKFWVAPLFGAFILLIFNVVDFSHALSELTKANAINPIQILILFISMTFISIVLDELGLFKYLASVTLKKAKSKQITLFCLLYLLTSVLTVFTSNDIIILTFTPFIIFFCKNAVINPLPYLFCEFVAANTWSMIFIIGNPTNIYLATSLNIGFLEYFKVMCLPTIAAGISSFLILLFLFRYQLSEGLNIIEIETEKIEKKKTLIISVIILAICVVFLVIQSFINIPMYLICLVSAILVLIVNTITDLSTKSKVVLKSLKSSPYDLIPFILSMFVLTLFFKDYDITKLFVQTFGENLSILKYGFSSFLVCNLINNIPMSIMYANIISQVNLSIINQATFSTIIASNIGAFLTPIGALAGIMWLNILKKNNISFSFKDFIKYGVIIAIPTLLISLLVLSFIL